DRMGRIAVAGASLALVVAVLGLFAYSAVAVVRRRKEIGVRKILGAGTPRILWIFLAESGRMLLLGYILALPLAWYFASEWLASYPYRISLGVEIAVMAFMLLSIPS